MPTPTYKHPHSNTRSSYDGRIRMRSHACSYA
nr:MAG TPA: hypothetical protein [Caudoviricetes sp.]